MPNLKPPIRTVEDADDYRNAILDVMAEAWFEPMMTLYMTDQTSPAMVHDIAKRELTWLAGIKLYPQGATTNSDAGVSDIATTFPVLEAMQETGLPLLIHGETTTWPDGSELDFFDREKRFIDTTLTYLYEHFPALHIVLEHITTKDAVQWVESVQYHPPLTDIQARGLEAYGNPPRVAATITAHHLLENRNAIFRNGLNPHCYCLPILKTEQDRDWLVRAATSGHPWFFAGTDSAPHPINHKESACGCAGCFTAPHALALYAEAFDQANALKCLENFTSTFASRFYGFELQSGSVTLTRKPFDVPEAYLIGPDPGANLPRRTVPFWAGKTLAWSIQ
jgi:dihydroorotase